MVKSEKQEVNEKELDQSSKKRAIGRIHRSKNNQKTRAITHYFSKVERSVPSNPNIPTTDKSLMEDQDEQTQNLKEKQKLLTEKKEEMQLRLLNQKEEHNHMMSRIKAAIIHELKNTAEIDRNLALRNQSHIGQLQTQMLLLKEKIQQKQKTIQKCKEEGMERHFLEKQLKTAQTSLKRVELELHSQVEQQKLHIEEENCYLAKESWPLVNKRYQSLRLIGKGGFSEVYQAYDLEKHCLVAIKLSDVQHLLAGRGNKHDYLKHIKRQYQVHKRLSHPNIVRLLDVLEVDNAICIILEHCEGQTLAQLLSVQDRLAEQEAKLIVRCLLSVISYLSNQRIVHYDLKPQNIIFHEGAPKVLDFGICKIIDNQHSKMALTSQGVGTYCYLPPQTFASNNPLLSNKVDIWSLGVIFYQMLYGYRPATNGDLLFPSDVQVSHQAKLFIQGCLMTNLSDRLDPIAAQQHLYFQQN